VDATARDGYSIFTKYNVDCKMNDLNHVVLFAIIGLFL